MPDKIPQAGIGKIPRILADPNLPKKELERLRKEYIAKLGTKVGDLVDRINAITTQLGANPAGDNDSVTDMEFIALLGTYISIGDFIATDSFTNDDGYYLKWFCPYEITVISLAYYLSAGDVDEISYWSLYDSAGARIGSQYTDNCTGSGQHDVTVSWDLEPQMYWLGFGIHDTGSPTAVFSTAGYYALPAAYIGYDTGGYDLPATVPSFDGAPAEFPAVVLS